MHLVYPYKKPYRSVKPIGMVLKLYALFRAYRQRRFSSMTIPHGQKATRRSQTRTLYFKPTKQALPGSPSVTLTRATSLDRWRLLHHLPYYNPVGRGLAPAVVYATTNLGRFVGAIISRPFILTTIAFWLRGLSKRF